MGLGRFRQEASFATEDVLSTSRVEQTAVEKDHKIREICKISTLIFIRRRSYQIYIHIIITIGLFRSCQISQHHYLWYFLPASIVNDLYSASIRITRIS